MNNPEMNMQFMQIAMKHLPEAKGLLEAKGIQFDLDDLQPMVDMLLSVMSEAYELGKEAGQKGE